MRTEEVVAHFGSKAEIARALGVSYAAVTQWGDEVPPFRQLQIQQLTLGKLRASPDVFVKHTGQAA